MIGRAIRWLLGPPRQPMGRRNPHPPGTMLAAWWDLERALRDLGHEILVALRLR